MTHPFVAVLTSSAPLSDDDAAAIAADLPAAGAPRRLGAGAVEVPLSARVPRPEVPGVDVNVLPAEGREKRLLIADMDSTLIEVECIDELADFLGVKDRVAEITEAAMRGELDFEAALDARVALLKGLPVGSLQRCYDERVAPAVTPGAAALMAGMAARGAATALVSGGFTFFTQRVAALIGVHSHRANVLEEADGALTGTVARPVVGPATKGARLAELCAGLGVPPAAAVAVGDGANDLAMVRAAGLGVAWRAKPALKAEADAVLDHSDLTAVLALQGLPTGR